MNLKQTIAATILLLPIVVSSVIAKPAAAGESQNGRNDRDRTVVVVESKDGHGHHKEEFRRHQRRIWVPGHWETNRFGHRYWVHGRYEYRYF